MVQHQQALDRTFSALSDVTRRAILLKLGKKHGTLGELAADFDMSLTGLKKHVHVLEDAGLVTTEKIGRERHCRLGPKRLDDAAKWMATYRTMFEQRMDHLEQFLERTKGQSS